MGSVIDVSDATFERDVVHGSAQAPVIVDFWAAWCGPCRALGPTLEQVVRNAGDVTLAKLDVDANPQTSMRFGIRGIPAVKAFRDGAVIAEFVGLQPRQAVERFVGALVMRPAAALPESEDALRELLDEDPANLTARRALGRLLISGASFDDARIVLEPGLPDIVCDGLLARIELMQRNEAPAELDHGLPADELRAAAALLSSIPTAAAAQRDRLRRVVLGIIEEQGANGVAQQLRQRLASALF